MYKNFGNILVNDSCNTSERNVLPINVLRTSNLVLKIYEMYRERVAFSESFIDCNIELIKHELKNGSINPYIGIGFALISENFLNVARWDLNAPIVIRNTLYSIKFDGTKLEAQQKEINEEGAFCAFELEVVSFEAREWRKYLASAHDEKSKKLYMSTFFKGKVKSIESVLLGN